MFLNTGACKKICEIIDVRYMWEKSAHNGNETFEHLECFANTHTHTMRFTHCRRIYGKHGLRIVCSLTDCDISKIKIKKTIPSIAGNLLIIFFGDTYHYVTCCRPTTIVRFMQRPDSTKLVALYRYKTRT